MAKGMVLQGPELVRGPILATAAMPIQDDPASLLVLAAADPHRFASNLLAQRLHQALREF